MTKISVWGEKEPKKPEGKPIEFLKCLNTGCKWEAVAIKPNEFDFIQLVQKGRNEGNDLMFAWDNHDDEPTIYRGNWNDGFVKGEE